MAVRQKNSKHIRSKKNFRQLLFDGAMAPPRFEATYNYYPDIDSRADPGPLIRLLGVGDGFLSDREAQTLSFLEENSNTQPDRHYSEFKWRVLTFLSVQDIFDAPLLAGTDLRSLFRQWYFYYESKYLLIETILCSLNGFVGAQGSLLRLYLEFNLLQNYFFRNINNQRSYELLKNYVKKGLTLTGIQ